MLFFIPVALSAPGALDAGSARAMVFGGVVRGEDAQGLSAGFDGEVGVGSGVAVGLRVPWASSTDPAGSLIASDVALKLSGVSVDVPFELGFSAEVNFPLYELGEGTTLVSADGRSAPGDGSIDVDLGTQISRAEGPVWIGVSAAYRHHFGDFADVVPWRAEVILCSPAFELGVDVDGSIRIWPDTATRQWVRVGGSLAFVGLRPLRVQAFGGYLPWAEAMPTGWGAGVGLGLEG